MENTNVKVINLAEIRERKEGKVIQFPGAKEIVTNEPKKKNKKVHITPKNIMSGVKLPKIVISKKLCLSLAVAGFVVIGGINITHAINSTPSAEKYIQQFNREVAKNFDSVLSTLEKEVATNPNNSGSSDAGNATVTNNVSGDTNSTAEEQAIEDNTSPSVFDTGLSISSSATVSGEYSEYTINFTASVDGSKLKEKDGILDFDKKHIKIEVTSVEDNFTDEERAILAEDKSMIDNLAKEVVSVEKLANKDLDSNAGREKLKKDLLASQ